MSRHDNRPICCLCGRPLGDGHGHNPAPLAQPPAVCCSACNNNKVIPARMRALADLSAGDEPDPEGGRNDR